MTDEQYPVTGPRWARNFFPIWLGQAFSMLGSGLVQFALVWYLTDKTGSTAILATATLVAILPQAFLSPFAGALVDRWNRRWVQIISDAITAFAILVLAALFLTNHIQTWHIFVIMFIRSLGGAFQFPAMQASTSLMVPQKHLSRLAGANQALQGLLTIAAPPLGALLMALIPIQSILSIDVITAILAITPLFFVFVPQPELTGGNVPVTPRVVLKDVAAGLRYVFNWRGMLVIILMATAINFLYNPAFTFLPLLVTRHFNGGAAQLGWLESAYGIGVVAGGLLLGAWGGFRRKIVTSLVGLISSAVGILLIGLASPSGYSLALTGMLVLGLTNPLINGPIFALLQTKVEPQMQGRVFTTVMSLAIIASPLSLAIAAPVAEWLGLQSWYIIGGIVTFALTTIAFFNRDVMSIDDQQPGGILQLAAEVAVPAASD